MSGINSGILANATPLSTEAINELERKVLETGEAYAYLDQDSKLCFAMPHGVDGIQELAWNNAHELSSESGTLTKKTYKKTGLKTFTLDKTFTKSSIDEPWLSNSIFKFYGDYANYQYETHSDSVKLVKVSNKFFSKQDLLSSTISIHEFGIDANGTVEYPVTDQMFSCDEAYDETCDVTLSGVQVVNADLSLVISVINPTNDPVFPKTGTYFLYLAEDQTGDGIIDGTLYTSSISCLTEADAIQPTERLEGDGQEFYTAAPSTLSFRSTAPLNEFQDVQINGQTVDPSNYTLEEGSTIVKLSYEYLKTLDVGSYELSIISNSKTAKGDFTVTAPELNEYGFYYNVPYFCETYKIPNPDYSDDPDNNEEYIYEIADLAVVFMTDGSVKKIDFGGDEVGNTDEVFFENGVVTFCHDLVYFTGHFSDDGKAIVTDQVYGMPGSFLDGYVGPGLAMPIATQVIAVDANYFYLIHDNYVAFGVIDNTKSEYPKVKPYVYDKPVSRSVYGTFSGNTQLTNMQALPDTYSDTAVDMFSGCTKLTNIDLPEGLTYIEAYTFRDCSALTHVTLPSTLSGIGMHAFPDCVKLNSISFKGTIAQWNTLDLLENWNQGLPATYIQCLDGRVAI